MTAKYLPPMQLKYDFNPHQLLFRPSSPSTSKTPPAKPPSYVPMATINEPTASMTGTSHRVPSPPRHSTDSDISASARLINPSHDLPEDGCSINFHPTSILRLVAGVFLITSLSLLTAHDANNFALPIVFVCFAFIRILATFAVHPRRDARWLGWRGINLAIDAAFISGLSSSLAVALHLTVINSHHRYNPNKGTTIAACAVGWVAAGLLAIAAIDTGRPREAEYGPQRGEARLESGIGVDGVECGYEGASLTNYTYYTIHAEVT
ncbi:hypothetical protein O988_04270 [Pseudogymnoascus sp. VKM F-3808]|nr:hypothetical protein O988_04270 [Pseudogymnoascus sp. VKM F-3808]